MGNPKIPDGEFIALFEKHGAAEMARVTGMEVRGIYSRRTTLEGKLGRQITGPERYNQTRHNVSHPERATVDIENGTVLVGSDLHAWPGEPSTAFRAFVKFIKKLRPKCVILNGDVIDGASISRHPPIGWEKHPTLIDEIEVAQELLHKVTMAAPMKARLIWPLGNHDARFSTRIATVAPEYAKIHGVRLQDHFGERWEPCWSVWINGDVVVKHRGKGGVHATHNNAVQSGKTMITGHLHSLKVTPYSDYTDRTRFGVDTGCLANVGGPQFRYLEDGFVNWRSGFIVLTFRDGRLMWPEVCHVIDDGEVEFRSELIQV